MGDQIKAIGEMTQVDLAKLQSKGDFSEEGQARLTGAQQREEQLRNVTLEWDRARDKNRLKKVATVAGGVGVGLAALLAGGYALYNHFSGSGNMDPPGENAEPEERAPDNAIENGCFPYSPAPYRLGVKKRPGKAERKPSARRRKRG